MKVFFDRFLKKYPEAYKEPSQISKMEIFVKVDSDLFSQKDHLRCLTGF